jgi:hypothetical protein
MAIRISKWRTAYLFAVSIVSTVNPIDRGAVRKPWIIMVRTTVSEHFLEGSCEMYMPCELQTLVREFFQVRCQRCEQHLWYGESYRLVENWQ